MVKQNSIITDCMYHPDVFWFLYIYRFYFMAVSLTHIFFYWNFAYNWHLLVNYRVKRNERAQSALWLYWEVGSWLLIRALIRKRHRKKTYSSKVMPMNNKNLRTQLIRRDQVQRYGKGLMLLIHYLPCDLELS